MVVVVVCLWGGWGGVHLFRWCVCVCVRCFLSARHIYRHACDMLLCACLFDYDVVLLMCRILYDVFDSFCLLSWLCVFVVLHVVCVCTLAFTCLCMCVLCVCLFVVVCVRLHIAIMLC